MIRRQTVAEFQKYNRPKLKKFNNHFITKKVSKYKKYYPFYLEKESFLKRKLSKKSCKIQ